MPKPVMLPPLPSHVRAEDIALALLQPKSPDQVPLPHSAHPIRVKIQSETLPE